MNKKHNALILAGILLLAGVVVFLASGGKTFFGGTDRAGTALSVQQGDQPPWDDDDSPAGENAGPGSQENAAAPLPHPKDIEAIKKQIYDLCIETVDDIPKLDRVVQTGNAQTRAFWAGGWTSVDDFKEEANGFNLEPQPDGTYIFYPDENTTKTYTFFETPRTYQYDPTKKEFFWEQDYYGKTISHRVRFINDNVVAMMLVSGSKVSLDLYQKQPQAPE